MFPITVFRTGNVEAIGSNGGIATSEHQLRYLDCLIICCARAFANNRGAVGNSDASVSVADRDRSSVIGLAVLCASVIALAVPMKSYAETAAPRLEQMTADAVRQRGESLRAEIDATYKQLRASNTIRIYIKGGNDVTAIVLKYIPVGISIDDGEAILRAAGYNVGHTEEGHVFSRARLGGGLFELYSGQFAADLWPQAADDFRSVGEVSATIAATYVPPKGR